MRKHGGLTVILCAVCAVFACVCGMAAAQIPGVDWTHATADAAWPSRFDHVSAGYDGKLWVLGAYGNGNHRNDVWYTTDGAANDAQKREKNALKVFSEASSGRNG